jgi:OmpA-OmpF porin, OOP family
MKIIRLIVAGIIIAETGSTAFAQTGVINDWYVAPIASFSINSPHRAKDHGAAGAVALGKVLNESWNVELSGQYVDFGANDHQASIGLDALYFIKRNRKFSPYITLGLGGVYEGPLPNDSKNQYLMLRGGIGFTTNITRNIDFRMDARYQWHGSTAGAPNLGDYFISGGLNIYF